MIGRMQPPGHGSEYVTDYGKDEEQQPGGGPPIASPDGFAIASLFLALVWLGGLGSLLAVIFGHISRGRAKRNGLEPSGWATAGTVLGWVGIAVMVLVLPMAII